MKFYFPIKLYRRLNCPPKELRGLGIHMSNLTRGAPPSVFFSKLEKIYIIVFFFFQSKFKYNDLTCLKTSLTHHFSKNTINTNTNTNNNNNINDNTTVSTKQQTSVNNTLNFSPPSSQIDKYFNHFIIVAY